MVGVVSEFTRACVVLKSRMELQIVRVDYTKQLRRQRQETPIWVAIQYSAKFSRKQFLQIFQLHSVRHWVIRISCRVWDSATRVQAWFLKFSPGHAGSAKRAGVLDSRPYPLTKMSVGQRMQWWQILICAMHRNTILWFH